MGKNAAGNAILIVGVLALVLAAVPAGGPAFTAVAIDRAELTRKLVSVKGEMKQKDEVKGKRTGLKPGRVFRDCPEMVVVPAGSFMMVSHRVTITRPFAVGKYEVTFAEWEACANDGGCNGHLPDDKGWGRGRRPVLDVSWYDAKGYVKWLSENTGKPYRLLSEMKWEYAARGKTRTSLYWDGGFSKQYAYANGADETFVEMHKNWTGPIAPCRDGFVYTSSVSSFMANGFGLHDMLGNLWEWVEDCWNSGYWSVAVDGNPWVNGDCSKRVLRGASWSSLGPMNHLAYRYWFSAEGQGDSYGFRVARTLAPSMLTSLPRVPRRQSLLAKSL